MPSLADQFPVSDEQFQNSLKKIINKLVVIPGVTTVPNPTAILLGGQPGAGKTSLQQEAEKLLADNAVICNADVLRDYHPQAKEIKTTREMDYPEITAALVQRWRKELCRYCVTNKLNFIMETTFSSSNDINVTLSTLKQAGYSADIMLLAVPRIISLLSTHTRYESAKAESSSGRIVPTEQHDIRFNNLVSSIEVVEAAKQYDNFSIYARAISMDIQSTHSNDGVVLLEKNPVSPKKLVAEFIGRKWPKEWPQKLIAFYVGRCNYVLDCMRKRNATPEEQKKFLETMEINKKTISQYKGIKLSFTTKDTKSYSPFSGISLYSLWLNSEIHHIPNS